MEDIVKIRGVKDGEEFYYHFLNVCGDSGIKVNGENVDRVERKYILHNTWFKTKYPIRKVEKMSKSYITKIYVTDNEMINEDKRRLSEVEYYDLRESIKDLYRLEGDIEDRWDEVKSEVEEISGTWNPLEMGELSLDLISMLKLDENEWGNGRCKKNHKYIFSNLMKRMKKEKWGENKNLRVSEDSYYKELRVYRRNGFTGEESEVFHVKQTDIRDIVGENKKEVMDKEEELIGGIIEKVKTLGGQTCLECRGSGFIPLNIEGEGGNKKEEGEERISSSDLIDNITYRFKLMIGNEGGLSKKKEDKIFMRINKLREEFKENYAGWLNKKKEISVERDKNEGDNKVG